ncbi:MAG: hypothetical protein NVV72_09540 [Asticcacaulis sp.]|nr:hypothetical protein [Asticcacaulis sp.]
MTDQANYWPVAVSGISALIASGALWVTFNKYRMDMYDRRFSIYTATLDLYFAITSDAKADLGDKAKPFIKACRESQYLFDDRSGIYETLEQFRTEYNKLKISRDEAAKPIGRRSPQKVDAALGSPIILEDKLKKLEGLMMPYLTYRMIDWPSCIRYFGKKRAKFDR